MANAIINNKFLHYKTVAAFESDLTAGYVRDNSIALIKDKSAIWSHGKYFYCSDTEFDTVVKTITDRLDVIEGEDEGSIAYAVNELSETIMGLLGEVEEGKTIVEMIEDLQKAFEGDVMEDGYIAEVLVGGLNKGTNVGGKSAIEVLDLILKPEYAPVWTNATATLSCTGKTANAAFEVGSTTPAESDYVAGGNPAQAVGGNTTVKGGNPTNTFATSGTCGAGFAEVTTKPGTFIVTLTRAYAAGTAKVVTNKGTETNKTGAAGTLLENGTANTGIDASSHVIKAVSKTATFTLNYGYKIYATTGTVGVLTDNGVKTALSNTQFVLKGGKTADGGIGQKIAIPSSYTNVKIEELDAFGGWNVVNWNTDTTNYTIGDNTTSKAYTIYTRDGETSANCTIRVSATVK